jgi:hypothetical protein
MADAFPGTPTPSDPRAVAILAKNFYREFRAGGFSERDVMALASELLDLVTTEVRSGSAPRKA